MISFEDHILIFFIWAPNITIEGTMEKIQFKQHFATNFRPSNKKLRF
jgi:hypothetical protein